MRLREHPAISRSGHRFRIDPRVIKIEPGLNLRDLDSPAERPALDNLKAYVRENGVPGDLEIRLVGEDIFLTDGHRRLKVTNELIDEEGFEVQTVSAVEEPPTVNDAERNARVMVHGAGEPLKPLKIAEGVRRQIEVFGWPRDQVAKRFGWTEQTIRNYLDMVAMPEAVKDQVREGAISATTARQVVRRDGPLLAAETINTARETAKASGKSKVTPRQIATAKPLSRGTGTAIADGIKRDTIAVFSATLREIAEGTSEDPEWYRRQARLTLKNLGQFRDETPDEAPSPKDIEQAILTLLTGDMPMTISEICGAITLPQRVSVGAVRDAVMRLVAHGEAWATEDDAYTLPPVSNGDDGEGDQP